MTSILYKNNMMFVLFLSVGIISVLMSDIFLSCVSRLLLSYVWDWFVLVCWTVNSLYIYIYKTCVCTEKQTHRDMCMEVHTCTHAHTFYQIMFCSDPVLHNNVAIYLSFYTPIDLCQLHIVQPAIDRTVLSQVNIFMHLIMYEYLFQLGQKRECISKHNVELPLIKRASQCQITRD